MINDDTVGGCYLTKLKQIASHCQLNPLCFSFAWSMCKTELKKRELVSFRLFERLSVFMFYVKTQTCVDLSENYENSYQK